MIFKVELIYGENELGDAFVELVEKDGVRILQENTKRFDVDKMHEALDLLKEAAKEEKCQILQEPQL